MTTNIIPSNTLAWLFFSSLFCIFDLQIIGSPSWPMQCIMWPCHVPAVHHKIFGIWQRKQQIVSNLLSTITHWKRGSKCRIARPCQRATSAMSKLMWMAWYSGEFIIPSSHQMSTSKSHLSDRRMLLWHHSSQGFIHPYHYMSTSPHHMWILQPPSQIQGLTRASIFLSRNCISLVFTNSLFFVRFLPPEPLWLLLL